VIESESKAVTGDADSSRANPRVLLIEDDQEVALDIEADLVSRGYHVTHCATGPAGLEAAGRLGFDVIVIDRMLPELDGLSVIEALRAAKVTLPVLVLSALSAVSDRVRGLKAGGDDYLGKPFALEELAARVEALLRRPFDTRQVTTLRVGPLRMDLIAREVSRAGRIIELLPTEFKLLEYMLRRPKQVVTRAMLLEDVWHYRFLSETNVVDVHVGKMRRKVDAPGEPPMIQSIRGAGFMLAAP
jgi:two-component system OmpR family response regulator